MSDLKCEAVNLPGRGAQRSNYGHDNPRGWTLSHTPLRLSGFTVDLYQRPVFVRERLIPLLGQQVQSTNIYVRDVSEAEFDRAVRICEDLCWLLSFGSLSQVRPAGFRYRERFSVRRSHAVMQQFRPPLGPDAGRARQTFINAAWSQYRVHKRRRLLPEVIDYLTTAERREQPIEVKTLLASVALESLKTTWARRQGIDFVKGRFVYRTARGKWAPYGFEKLVNMMLKSAGMNPIPKRIVGLRNEIVHVGISTRPVERLAELYSILMALLVEYLLRFLGYEGEYIDYRTNQAVRLR